LIEALFREMLSQRAALGIVALSFAGGVVSSLLPCTLSMLPLMVGYIGGFGGESKLEALKRSVLFILGLALVLSVFGVLASLLGVTFGAWVGEAWYFAMGALALLMGLQLLGVLHLPLPAIFKRLPDVATQQGRWFAPLLLGMAFGASASPCGTPYLTGLLGFISHTQNVLLGGISLFAYALGQGVLLLAAGLFTGVLRHIARIRRVSGPINLMSGVLFVLSGLMLIGAGAGWLAPLSAYLGG
jgi:cytochrome c-type biogenesis protein